MTTKTQLDDIKDEISKVITRIFCLPNRDGNFHNETTAIDGLGDTKNIFMVCFEKRWQNQRKIVEKGDAVCIGELSVGCLVTSADRKSVV